MRPLKSFAVALGCYALLTSLGGCGSEQSPDSSLTPSPSYTAPAKALPPADKPDPDTPATQFPPGPYSLPNDPVELAQIEAGTITAPEHALSVLQLLFDREYQAFMDLDPNQLDPGLTLGWEFPNGDYEFLSELGDSGAHGVGHTPAQILSVAQVSNLPTGDWELTVLTSELGLEIKDAQGISLLDTRGDGPTMATYTISFAAN